MKSEKQRLHLKKLADSRRGKERLSNKGIKHYLFGKHHPSPMTGKKHSEESKRKISEAHKGKKHSETTRNKMSINHSGEKSCWWKGGITPINKKIRGSLEYTLWREAVFKRDNYTCLWCGDNKGGNLNADHIKPFALFPELRFAIDNGRTLCVECHQKTNTYGGKYYKFNK